MAVQKREISCHLTRSLNVTTLRFRSFPPQTKRLFPIEQFYAKQAACDTPRGFFKRYGSTDNNIIFRIYRNS
jgi:hypothetical protein